MLAHYLGKKGAGAKLGDFVPFNKKDVKTFALNGETDEVQAMEVTIMAWICARFLKCLVSAKVVPVLETSELFAVASYDDVAFLLISFEDSFDVWMKMAAAKQSTSEPVNKKVCRRDYKEEKTYKSGIGLSGQEAQKRYVIIRNGVRKYLTMPEKKAALEKRYSEEVEDNRKWEEESGLREKQVCPVHRSGYEMDVPVDHILDDGYREEMLSLVGFLGTQVEI